MPGPVNMPASEAVLTMWPPSPWLLINGTTVEEKITQGGVIKKLMTSNRTPREIASELFLRCFGRFPTETELTKLEKYWGVTEEQPKAYHDIFWALLNAKEFMFNH